MYSIKNPYFRLLLLFFAFSWLSLFPRCHGFKMDQDEKLTGEIVKMGCFKYWSGIVGENPWDRRSISLTVLLPEECLSICEIGSFGEGVVAMVKGVFCMCTKLYRFTKEPIDQKYCDLGCGSNTGRDRGPEVKGRGRSFENTTLREEFGSCGGNIGVSAYCREGFAGCTERYQNSYLNYHGNEKKTREIQIRNQVEDSGSVKILPSLCAVCKKSDEESDYPEDGPKKCVLPEDSIGTDNPVLDYFPLNSPEACINHCRNLYYSLAILQWTPFVFDKTTLPLSICRCWDGNPFSLNNWREMYDEYCSTKCPGDAGAICGTKPDYIDPFTAAYVSIYCAVDGEVCKTLDLGDGIVDFTTPGPETGKSEKTSTSFSGGDSTSNTTEFPADENSSSSTTGEDSTTTKTTMTTSTKKTTPTTSSTWTKNTTRSTSTQKTTKNTTPEQFTTEPPTTQTETTTRSTTKSPKTTTEPSPCETVCKAMDLFNQIWSGCLLQLVEKPCEGGNSSYKGVARWRCLPSGIFEGSMPDFSNCSSVWPEDLWMFFKNVTNDITEPLSMETSEAMLEIMEERSRISDKNKLPYYGHEISRISSLIWNVVNQTSANFEERKRLISKGSDVASILLLNQNPWQLLNDQDKAAAGTKILESFEFSMFTLSQHVHQEAENQLQLNFTQTGTLELRKSEYQSTFGAVSKKPNSNKTEALVFPLGANAESSFIQLAKGWEDLIETDVAEFVGISLDSKYIKNILPLANKSLEINGRLLSLTLKGLKQEPQKNINLKNLQGRKVNITFQHDVTATAEKTRNWIPYSLTRQIQTREEKSFVLGSAICVFWHIEKMDWATDGCSVVESTGTFTICECSHLTSFALLMDPDPQHTVTTGFGLELLTFILCPVSVICLLASFVIFSSAGSTMRENTKTQITKHLAVCLLLGNLAILFVVDPSYFNLPKGLCTAVGMATHYIFLCAFFWMQIEGIHLYKLIVVVFESERNYELVYKICAYAVPLAIVILTSLIGFLGNSENPYDGEKFCWLKGEYIWSFMAPAAFTIVANNIILLLAYKTASQIKANTTTAFMRKKRGNYRMWIRGSFSVTIILGLTWLPGFFIATDSAIISTIAAYIFVILNASQGIFIFIFHCWMNDAVWTSAKKNFARYNAISKFPLALNLKGSKNTNTNSNTNMKNGTNTFSSTQEISSKST